MLEAAEPEGLKLLHATATVAEAELLRQVLTEAGFQIEYVPSSNVGVFGATGSNSIYIRPEEFGQASEFLNEYLDAEPILEDEPLTEDET